jgi:hypothetical protein
MRILLLLLITLAGQARAAAETAGGTTQADLPGPFFLAPAHDTLYAMVSTTLVISQVPIQAPPLIMKLLNDVEAARAKSIGPLVMIYAIKDLKAPFLLQIGIPVEAKGPANPNFSFVPIHHAAAMCCQYRGDTAGLSDAWGKLFTELDRRKLTGSGRTSEEYLCWLDAASHHNIIQLAIELPEEGVPAPEAASPAAPPATKPEF